jgi:hypothetical protein
MINRWSKLVVRRRVRPPQWPGWFPPSRDPSIPLTQEGVRAPHGHRDLTQHRGQVPVTVPGRPAARAGFTDEATTLAEQLLAAAVTFDFRMPELYSGDDAAEVAGPSPDPAACRPQAWSAAAAIPVWTALTGR